MIGPRPAIVVTLRPRGYGKALAMLGERELTVSHQPLFDCARLLLAEGHPPETIIATRWEGSDHLAMTARLDKAAKLTTSEPDRSAPAFVCWRPHPRGAGRPIAGQP